MRRLAATLLATCLLTASAAPAIAQEPPPPPWFGGRVEMASEGIAVTIPGDWVAIDLTADVESQLDEVDLPAATPGDSNAELLLWSPAGDACGMDIVEATAAELHDPEFLERLEASLESNPDVSDYDGLSWLDLPAGRALAHRYRYTYPEEYGGQTLERQSYWIAGDPWSMIITCDGTDPVAAERMAIAESFEWLRPADTAGMGARLEVVDAGVAMTFPDDWVVLRLGDTAVDELLATVRQTHPRWVETVATQLEQLDQLGGQGYTFRALVLSPATPKDWPGSTCFVQTTDLPVGHSLDQLLATELEAIKTDPLLTEGPELTELSSAGGGQRIDNATRSASGRDLFHSLFLLDTEAALTSDAPEVQLGCLSFEGYIDDWLPIAESFEYLSEEG